MRSCRGRFETRRAPTEDEAQVSPAAWYGDGGGGGGGGVVATVVMVVLCADVY